MFEIKSNVSSRIVDGEVSQRPYTVQGSTMTPDTYGDIIIVQRQGSFDGLADAPLEPGDYVKAELDPKLKLYGYLNPDEVTFPDLYSTEDDSVVVAQSYYDADERAVYYVFTEFVNGKEGKQLASLEFQTQAVLSVDRSNVPTSGAYTFHSLFGNTPLDFDYRAEYASKLPNPIVNQAYNKSELTASRVKLDWVNPSTNVYGQSFFVRPVDKGDQTIASRRTTDFGFSVLGGKTPNKDAVVKVYEVEGAPDTFPENFVIPNGVLKDVTDLFSVTNEEGGGLRFAPRTPGATPATSYYYIHVRNSFDPSVDFESSLTALNYADGQPVGDQAKVSVGNQFSKDQLAGLARPVYAEVPGRSFVIEKVDEDGLPLSGAVFAVLDADGAQVDTITTVADGTAASKVLPLGSYTIRETTPPDGYEVASDQAVDTKAADDEKQVVARVVDKKIPHDPVVPDEPDSSSPDTPDTPDIPDAPNPDAPGAPAPSGGDGSGSQAVSPVIAVGHHLPQTGDMATAAIVAAAALLVFCAVGFLVAHRARRRK